jgi:hypothetical protein
MKPNSDYVHVGDVLRDALVEDIEAIAWEGEDKVQADKIKAALQIAAPHRGGYLLDTSSWTSGNFDFLRQTLSSVEETEGHSFMSAGYRLGSTRIGRQLYALKDKL